MCKLAGRRKPHRLTAYSLTVAENCNSSLQLVESLKSALASTVKRLSALDRFPILCTTGGWIRLKCKTSSRKCRSFRRRTQKRERPVVENAAARLPTPTLARSSTVARSDSKVEVNWSSARPLMASGNEEAEKDPQEDLRYPPPDRVSNWRVRGLWKGWPDRSTWLLEARIQVYSVNVETNCELNKVHPILAALSARFLAASGGGEGESGRNQTPQMIFHSDKKWVLYIDRLVHARPLLLRRQCLKTALHRCQY